jgi:hypothetical protein
MRMKQSYNRMVCGVGFRQATESRLKQIWEKKAG